MITMMCAPIAASQKWIPKGRRTGSRHVIRGASWALGSRTELRLSYRDAGADGRLDVGFRIARYVDRPGASHESILLLIATAR